MAIVVVKRGKYLSDYDFPRAGRLKCFWVESISGARRFGDDDFWPERIAKRTGGVTFNVENTRAETKALRKRKAADYIAARPNPPTAAREV